MTEVPAIDQPFTDETQPEPVALEQQLAAALARANAAEEAAALASEQRDKAVAALEQLTPQINQMNDFIRSQADTINKQVAHLETLMKVLAKLVAPTPVEGSGNR